MSAVPSVAELNNAGHDVPKPGRFGAFGGVFTPSILTILGVVMYMRLGWVTGQAGLARALIVVVVAHLISLATGLSVSSIATNRTVGAGGAYFMISRALGAPAGAAIGIPLFFAQAFSVTFYVVGFTEAFFQVLRSVEALQGVASVLPPWLVSTVLNVALTALSLRSAELAIRAQYVVMAAIVLSLVAFFTGRSPDFPQSIEWFNGDGAPFSEIFAVFFPAVTGIMAGVSMSGDLRDPRRAIPLGTLAAIGVGFVVYMAFPIWLGLNYDNDHLIEHLDSVFQVASVPALIYLGVWGATLSSALGSILTAPRTLQALALDGLAPGLLGKGYGPDREPRAGLAVTFLVAQAGLFLGQDLDAIAATLTMFFLATYGVTNLACGLQKWAASPSFRPSFVVPAGVSLGGAVACFYVMSVIDVGAMMSAALVSGVIFLVAQRKALGTTYGDSRHGIWAALVRTALHRLRRVEFHPQNWRPNLVILGGDPSQRPHLLMIGSWIVQDRGVVTYFQLLKGPVSARANERRELIERFEPQFAAKYPHVFYRAEVVEDVYRGIVGVSQSYGVGSFEANTVMLGWPKKDERAESYLTMLRDLANLQRSLLLVHYNEERRLGVGKEIHVWCRHRTSHAALMLLVAFLVTAHHRWQQAELVVYGFDDNGVERGALERLVQESRIPAQVRLLSGAIETRDDTIAAESAHADLVVLSLDVPPLVAKEIGFFEAQSGLLRRLPTSILVHSARGFEAEDVLLDA